MTLKILRHPHGYTVKMGRKRSTSAPFPGHHLREYLLARGVPEPPAPPVTYAPEANTALREMYGNDTLGDCVIAASLHVEGCVTGNAGDPKVFTEAQVVQTYGWCGYVAGQPDTDQGCEIQPVLNQWGSHGLPLGSKLTGYLAVDPTNQAEIETAIYLFETLVFGLELPDAWVNPMPSGDGFVWDVAGAPDPSNGHCICGVGYTAAGVAIDTWGMEGTITWAAIAEYCAASVSGELYVVITPDILAAASMKAPDGLNWSQLVADFDAMGGTLPAPVPAPVPVPPTPPVPAPPAPVPGYTTMPLPAGVVGLVLQQRGAEFVELFPGGKVVVGLAVKG